jgi:hypothetical protein
MLAARLAIAEEMTAPGPLRAKNPRDDLAIPPLLPQRKSSRIARTVSEDPPLPEIIFPDAVHNFHADSLNWRAWIVSSHFMRGCVTLRVAMVLAIMMAKS